MRKTLEAPLVETITLGPATWASSSPLRAVAAARDLLASVPGDATPGGQEWRQHGTDTIGKPIEK